MFSVTVTSYDLSGWQNKPLNQRERSCIVLGLVLRHVVPEIDDLGIPRRPYDIDCVEPWSQDIRVWSSIRVQGLAQPRARGCSGISNFPAFTVPTKPTAKFCFRRFASVMLRFPASSTAVKSE